jgi:mono/diheme cytochrome c family protein
MKFTTIPGFGLLRRATVRVPAPLAATLLAVFLAGCGAGSVSPQVNPPAPNSSGATTSNYNGVAPASADVQAFKVAFWDNVSPQNRCGACHVQNNQQPSFARNDDINLAYQAAQTIVDLSNPSNSKVVAKVGGGHHCWLTNNQACADAMTTWIKNWAGTANAGSSAQIQLVAPPVIDPGQSRTYPTDPTLFGSTVHPLLKQYCARCHAPTAASPQAPYFAQTNVGQAYEAAKPKINLDVTTLSRFYVRLKEESHHCWNGDCNAAAAEMLAAINAFRDGVPLTSIDPSFVLSKALTLYDGTVASGGNRVESGLIAKFEFKTGTGTVAYDTSGVEPAVNLNLSGDVQWVGGWGVRVANKGKLQGTTTGSVKLLNRIKASGEYSVEAWVAPANVTQEDAYIVSYSGGAAARNFTLGQNLYDYDFMNRSSLTNANGMPAVSTPSAQRLAQATLQHVVLTYGPVNGRRIYVNGKLVNVADPQKGGNLNDWDDTFALVLGNEVSGDRPWSGILKMVALYDRALDLPAIQTNYAAGVGERYYLLFNVESIVNVPKAYVMFEVSQFDSYAYLFDKPTFLSLDPAAKPGSIALKGMRIGLNGAEPKAGQSYVPLDLTITDAGYDSTKGFPLSKVGAVIALEKGPAYDQFFLTFEQLGSKTNVRTEPVPVAPAPVNVTRPSDIGVRSFERVNATLSAITGVPTTQTAVATLFDNVKQALPTTENFQGFVGSHQTAIAQLAIQYCAVMVDDPTLRGAFFPGVNVAAPLDSAAKTVVVNQLVAKALNSGTTVLGTQPNPAAVQTELNALMDKLAQRGASTPTILKAACAAVTGSAGMLVQ